jgi:hypothetical protein
VEALKVIPSVLQTVRIPAELSVMALAGARPCSLAPVAFDDPSVPLFRLGLASGARAYPTEIGGGCEPWKDNIQRGRPDPNLDFLLREACHFYSWTGTRVRKLRMQKQGWITAILQIRSPAQGTPQWFG